MSGPSQSAPVEAFYQVYSPAQTDAIIDSLTRRAEFPVELSYCGNGAEYWRSSMEAVNAPSDLRVRDAETLLELHAGRLLSLVPPSRPVQVVELGPGTTRPVHGLLRHLLDRSRLAGYRAIDISAEMLKLAEKNLRAAFPDEAARFELCHGDFSGPDLARVLTAQGEPGREGPVRFVILAGGTLCNLADPDRVLRRVGEALSGEDMLVLTMRFDNGGDRPPFMEVVQVGGTLQSHQRNGLEMLNIDESWYVRETGFDPDRSEVFVRARLVRPVAVTFDAGDDRRTVSFEPGETILVWRYRYLDPRGVAELLSRNGFDVRLFRPGDSGEMALVAAGKRR